MKHKPTPKETAARLLKLRKDIAYTSDDVWRRLYESSKKYTTFIATKRVDSEAFDPRTRQLCAAGDTITALAWHSWEGPTSVRINRVDRGIYETCTPFSWVKEMGASDQLVGYMPPIGYTWDEVMAALDTPKQP